MKQLFAVIFFCIFISSCSLERKLDKAHDLIMSHPAAQQKIFPELLVKWPCVNDTIIHSETIDTTKTKIKFLPIYIPEVRLVFVGSNKYFDTLINGLSVHADSSGITIAGEYTCSQTVKHTVSYVQDGRLLSMARDSLQKVRIEAASFAGELISNDRQFKSYNKQIRQLYLYLVILLVIIVVITVLWLRFNILTAVKSIGSFIPFISKYIKR